MISVRVNEIFNYLSTDRKKDQCRQLGRVIANRSPVVETTNEGISNIHPQIDNSEDGRNICALVLVDEDSQSLNENDSFKTTWVASASSNAEEDSSSAADVDFQLKSQSNTQKVKTKKSCKNNKNLNNDSSDEKNECPEPVLSASNDKGITHKVSSDVEDRTPCSVISSSSRSRKKKGRRNQDRSSSAATLDMRSIGDRKVQSLSAEKCESPARQIPVVSEGSKKLDSSCLKKSKQSQGKVSSQKQTKWTAPTCESQSNLKVPVNNITANPALDCLGVTRRTNSSEVHNVLSKSSVPNSRKLDSLDTFDDFFEPGRYLSTQVDSDDQWTEVNRKFKRIVMTLETFGDVIGVNGNKLREVARVSNAHIETERQTDKAIVLIKGSSDQIQSAYNLITALANRPATCRSKKLRGRSAGCGPSTTATHSQQAVFNSCQSDTRVQSDLSGVAITMPNQSVQLHSSSAVESATLSVDDQSNYPYERCPMPHVPVKEYSLFDNVCNQSVERGLGRKDSPPPALPSQLPLSSSLFAYSTIRPPSHMVEADQALLAKAPGYRTSPLAGNAPMMMDNPFQITSGPHWERRSRKYSDSSSSGRSSEDSGFGSVVNNQGFTLQQNAVTSGFVRPDPLMGGDAQSSRSPLSCHSWSPPAPFISDYLSDVTSRLVDGLLPKSHTSNFPASFPMGQEEHYSIPDRPMTLPRIASDLNPNAPDFVYQPQAVNSSGHAGAQVFASESMEQLLDRFTPFEGGPDWKQFHGSEHKDYFDVDDFPPLGSSVQHHMSLNRTGLLY